MALVAFQCRTEMTAGLSIRGRAVMTARATALHLGMIDTGNG